MQTFKNPHTNITYNTQTGAIISDPDNKAASIGQSLPTAQPPTNAGAVVNSPTPKLPTNSPTTGNINDATASTKGVTSQIETQAKIRADQIQAERDAIAQTQSGKNESTFLSKLMGNKSPTEARNDATATTGIDPAAYFADQKARIAEIDSLTVDYNKIKADMDAAIANSYGNLATNSFINNEQAQITRNAAPRLNMLSANINAKSATLQALQGNFSEAQTFINQAVNDAVATDKFNLDMYSAFKSINEDAFDKLDAPYKDAYNFTLKQMENDLNQKTDNSKIVGNIFADAAKAGAPASILNSISSKIASGDVTGAYQVAGEYAGGVNPAYKAAQLANERRLARGGGEGGDAPSDVNTYAQAYLDGQVDITNIPQKIRASVIAKANEIAKAALEAQNVPVVPGAPVTAYGTGQAIGGGIKPVYEAFRPENLGSGIKSVANTVGSFFSGLFGR